jgi:dynein regulatory complex protein 1
VPAPSGCRLESDIAVLEQHLETMRATYQLDAEKLEYNYRVLLERDAGVHTCAGDGHA